MVCKDQAELAVVLRFLRENGFLLSDLSEAIADNTDVCYHCSSCYYSRSEQVFSAGFYTPYKKELKIPFSDIADLVQDSARVSPAEINIPAEDEFIGLLHSLL